MGDVTVLYPDGRTVDDNFDPLFWQRFENSFELFAHKSLEDATNELLDETGAEEVGLHDILRKAGVMFPDGDLIPILAEMEARIQGRAH